MELPDGHPLSAVFVDLDAMTFVLANGDTLPITLMLDEFGEECEAKDAIVVVGGSDAAGWWTVPLPGGDPVTIN